MASTNADKVEEILARAPIFAQLSGKSLQKLAASCVPRSYPEGGTVLEEGSVGLGMVLVTGGRIEVFKGAGAQRVTLATLAAGEILGEMALLDDQPRSASAVALEPTEALLLTRQSFRAAAEKDPEILWCVVPTLTERLRDLQARAVAAAEAGGAAATPAPAAPEAPASEPASGEKKKDREKDLAEALVKVLRFQYALLRSGIVGMTGMAKAGEAFFDALGKETGIRDAKDLEELFDKLPDGMASAARAALTESEDLPDDMLATYRRHA
jgi:CRP/FNR family transcriptional regulator